MILFLITFFILDKGFSGVVFSCLCHVFFIAAGLCDNFCIGSCEL